MEPTNAQFPKKPFPQAYLYPHQIEEFERQTAAHRPKVESKKPMTPRTEKDGSTSWVQD